MDIFTRNLKHYRTVKGLTQEQAAEALQVSTQTISRWECGTTLPDATLLPQIAQLYGISIDELYQETGRAYNNYAQRLGSIFEATLRPEDFLRADTAYQKLLQTENYTTEDLRLYGILHQHMMYVCIKNATDLYDRVIAHGAEENPQVYWATRRQKGYFLWELGRNQENIDTFLPLVESGSSEVQEWICLIQAYSLAGDTERAWQVLQQAQTRFPESATLHIYAGDLLRSMKRYDEAFPHWQRALELEPAWQDGAYSMASCYEELGEYGKACEIYHRIAEDLQRRGFEAEMNWPRSLAHRCRERMG